MARSRGQTFTFAARAILLLLPLLFIAVLVARDGVDVPYIDQWEGEYSIFAKMAHGTLGWSDFFAQHNEHRIFFPGLILYALAGLTHWNIRAELWVVLSLAVVMVLNVRQILRATGWRIEGTGFWLLLAAEVLILSPLHRENFLWGFQIAFLLPLACTTACLWVGREETARTRFLGTMALSVVSSFSIAGGFACWLISAPLLRQAGGPGTWRLHRRWWIAWTISFLGSLALYFHGYMKPPQHPDVWFFLHQPVTAAHYWLTYVGLPFAFGTALDSFAVAQASALGMILLFATAVAYLWGWRADEALMRRCLPWLGMAAICFINATATTLGRAGLGLWQALTSRYIIFAVLLPVALSFLVAAIYEHLRARDPGGESTRRVGVGLVVLGSAFALLHVLGALHVVPAWHEAHLALLKSKALVETINVVDEPELVGEYLCAPPLNDRINLLDGIGYLHPSVIKSKFISGIADAAKVPTVEYGAIEQVTRGPAHSLRMRGWAVLPGSGRAADAVLLTRDDAGGRPAIFALAEVENERPDAVGNDSASLCCGWQKIFKPGSDPAGTGDLKAWSFDAETGRAYRLAGHAEVPR